jgi:ankyrin repeat protein
MDQAPWKGARAARHKPRCSDKHSRSTLDKACNHASIEVVQCIVTHGAVMKAYGDNGCHPLHYACMRDANSPTVAADTTGIVDYIVSSSDPEILSAEYRSWDNSPLTPLHLAIQKRNWEAVENLQALGAKITDLSCLSRDLWNYAADARGGPFRRLLDLGASTSSNCSFYGGTRRTITAHWFDEYVCMNKTASEDLEENLKAPLQAGADINAHSCFFSFGASRNITVLRMVRDAGLDDTFVQVLLRHGAVEDEELEGE